MIHGALARASQPASHPASGLPRTELPDSRRAYTPRLRPEGRGADRRYLHAYITFYQTSADIRYVITYRQPSGNEGGERAAWGGGGVPGVVYRPTYATDVYIRPVSIMWVAISNFDQAKSRTSRPRTILCILPTYRTYITNMYQSILGNRV